MQKKIKKKKIPGAYKISTKEVPPFARQLAAMYASGLPLIQSLLALEDQTENKEFKKVLAHVRAQVEGGSNLSDACKVYPDIFDDLFVHMLRAGESGGILAETLARLATYLEDSNKLKAKVKSAMMYPMIVTIACTVLTGGMIIFIVPVFGEVYADFGSGLPGPTQVLMNISDVLRNRAPLLMGIITVVVVTFKKWKKTPAGELAWDKCRLKFPVFGEITLKVAIGRFASTYAQLIRSGVPILKALDIVAFAMGNKALGAIIHQGQAYVERGEPLSKALKESGKFPPMIIHMLSAGEQTGTVEDMLDNIADLYDEDVKNTLNGLTSMIEPFLIIFLGTVVGGIVVCMFLPIFKMHEIVN